MRPSFSFTFYTTRRFAHDECLSEPFRATATAVDRALAKAIERTEMSIELDFDTGEVVAWERPWSSAPGVISGELVLYRKRVPSSALAMLGAGPDADDPVRKKAFARAIPSVTRFDFFVDIPSGAVWLGTTRPMLREVAESGLGELLSEAARMNTPKTGHRAKLVRDSLDDYLRQTRPHAALPANLGTRFVAWLRQAFNTTTWVHHPELGTFTLRWTGAGKGCVGTTRIVVPESGVQPAGLTWSDVTLSVTSATSGAEWTITVGDTAEVRHVHRDNPTDTSTWIEDARELHTLARMLWRAFDEDFVTSMLTASPCMFPGSPEGGIHIGTRPAAVAVGPMFRSGA